MCEIEYFVDPKDKSHPKFKKLARYPLTLFPALSQSSGEPASEWKIGDAVAQVGRSRVYIYYIFFGKNKLDFWPTQGGWDRQKPPTTYLL